MPESDNHILAMIRDFLMSNNKCKASNEPNSVDSHKTLIYCKFDENMRYDKYKAKKEIVNKLKLSDDQNVEVIVHDENAEKLLD